MTTHILYCPGDRTRNSYFGFERCIWRLVELRGASSHLTALSDLANARIYLSVNDFMPVGREDTR
jgi:hypothetical protein